MNIAIIEKNKAYRESLSTVLNQIHDFNVVFDSDSFSGMDQLSGLEVVDIILLDSSIAEKKFAQLIEQIVKLFPVSKIIIISNYSDICYLDDLLRKGITDIIPKNAGKKEFEIKIRYAFYNNEKLFIL